MDICDHCELLTVRGGGVNGPSRLEWRTTTPSCDGAIVSED